MLTWRPLRSLLFGLLLVMAQTLAAAHALGHAAGADEGGLPSPVCEWCAAYGHLGAALPGALPTLEALPAPEHFAPRVEFQLSLPLRLAFHAQAPPLFS